MADAGDLVDYRFRAGRRHALDDVGRQNFGFRAPHRQHWAGD